MGMEMIMSLINKAADLQLDNRIKELQLQLREDKSNKVLLARLDELFKHRYNISILKQL